MSDDYLATNKEEELQGRINELEGKLQRHEKSNIDKDMEIIKLKKENEQFKIGGNAVLKNLEEIRDLVGSFPDNVNEFKQPVLELLGESKPYQCPTCKDVRTIIRGTPLGGNFVPTRVLLKIKGKFGDDWLCGSCRDFKNGGCHHDAESNGKVYPVDARYECFFEDNEWSPRKG